MKKVFAFLTVLGCLFACIPAYAGTLEDIAEVSDFFVEDGQLCGDFSSYMEFDDALKNAVLMVYRDSSWISVNSFNMERLDNGLIRFKVRESEFEDVVSEDAEVKAWVLEHVPDIVPDGTSRNKASSLVFNWICDNTEYNYDGVTFDCEASRKASSVFNEGTAVCHGYAAAFRAMVEAIPFTDGFVDWENGLNHTQVILVENASGSHCWNAVYDLDTNQWLHYDTTFADTDDWYKAYMLYYKKTAGEIAAVHSSQEDCTAYRYFY